MIEENNNITSQDVADKKSSGDRRLSYCSVSSGEDAYEEICKIARAHSLIIGAAGGVIVIGHPDEIAKVESKRNPSTVMDLWGIAPEGDQYND